MTPVQRKRLEEVLDAYGATTSRWPVEELDDLLALVGSSPEARALMDEHLRLDTALAMLGEPPASDRLADRLKGLRPPVPVSKVRPRPVALVAGWLGVDRWQPVAAGFAAASLLFAAVWFSLASGPSGLSGDTGSVSVADIPAIVPAGIPAEIPPRQTASAETPETASDLSLVDLPTPAFDRIEDSEPLITAVAVE